MAGPEAVILENTISVSLCVYTGLGRVDADEDIGKRFNLKANSVCDIIIKVKSKYFAPGIFNVHDYDCWIMPTKRNNEFNN